MKRSERGRSEDTVADESTVAGTKAGASGESEEDSVWASERSEDSVAAAGFDDAAAGGVAGGGVGRAAGRRCLIQIL